MVYKTTHAITHRVVNADNYWRIKDFCFPLKPFLFQSSLNFCFFPSLSFGTIFQTQNYKVSFVITRKEDIENKRLREKEPSGIH